MTASSRTMRAVAQIVREFVPRREDRLRMLDRLLAVRGSGSFAGSLKRLSDELRKLDTEELLSRRDDRDARHG